MLCAIGRDSSRKSMTMMSALAVIGEHLDHPALVDPAMAAALHHDFQLGLQRHQAADALLDLDEARLGDGVGGGAGLAADRPARLSSVRIASISKPSSRAWRMKARRLRSARSIGAPVALAAARRRKQADALVIADRRHLDAALAGRFADR